MWSVSYYFRFDCAKIHFQVNLFINKMSSYVPPHSRRGYANKTKTGIEKGQDIVIENTEENFPTLVSQTSVKFWNSDKKTFAQLATEWNEKAKEEEITKQAEAEESQRIEASPRYTHSLPKFHNVHRFVEPEDEPEEPPAVAPINDDGWVTVQRKIRREKTFQEKFNRPETPPQDTVWNADEHPNEHETCWEDKRY